MEELSFLLDVVLLYHWKRVNRRYGRLCCKAPYVLRCPVPKAKVISKCRTRVNSVKLNWVVESETWYFH